MGHRAPPTPLPPVEVTAPRVTPEPNSPPAVAVGAFLNRPDMELPQPRDTVTREELTERGQHTLYEELADVPGVTPSEGPTPMSRTAGQLTIRGFGGTDPMLNNFVMPRLMSLYADSITGIP